MLFGLAGEDVADSEVGDGKAHALFGSGGCVGALERLAGGHEFWLEGYGLITDTNKKGTALTVPLREYY